MKNLVSIQTQQLSLYKYISGSSVNTVIVLVAANNKGIVTWTHNHCVMNHIHNMTTADILGCC